MKPKWTVAVAAALALAAATALLLVQRPPPESVVSRQSPTSTAPAERLPDGTYLVLPVLRSGGASPQARRAAREEARPEAGRLEAEARRAGYENVKVVPMPGASSGCRVLETRPDGSPGVGCGDLGDNVGWLVVLRGPYADAPARPSEYLPWALDVQRREQAEAAARGLRHQPQVAFFEFSRPPGEDG